MADSGSKKLNGLLERIATGKNQKAFAELYSATKGKLFSTVLMIVRRPELAEEIIQEVYVRIWSQASSYQESRGSPMTWMITIARHMAIDHARKNVHENSPDDLILLTLPSEWPTPLETIEACEDERYAVEQRLRVFSALEALNPLRRDLVVRAYLHGESRQQLSKLAGVPVNTVKTWIRRALLEVDAILRNTKAGNVSSLRSVIASNQTKLQGHAQSVVVSGTLDTLA